jgi:tetratricopeptide (TPR) repeat protein
MKKLRYGAMSVAIVFGVCAFFALREFAPLPAWASRDLDYLAYTGDSAALSALITEWPDDYMAHYRRGMHLYQQGNYPAALTDLTAAVRLSPIPNTDNVAQSLHLRERRVLNRVFLVLTARAQVLWQMQRPAEALADFDLALALDGSKWDTYYQRAYVHMAIGNHPLAVKDFDVLLNRRPEGQTFFGRGLAKYFIGDWAGARADFYDAARSAPHNPAYALWLTRAHLRGDIPLEYAQIDFLQRHPAVWTFVQILMSDDEPPSAGAVQVATTTGSPALTCAQALLRGEWLSLHDRDAQPMALPRPIAHR